MSFDKQFDARWEKVIARGIGAVQVNGVPLQPYRVDVRKVSDSILTEILGNISNCRLIFADVTAYTEINGRAIRNGNVMYEVGLAHAARLPEEVILFRSDDAPLLFDVANVRVNKYDPDNNPDTAVRQIGEAITEATKAVNFLRLSAVQRVTDSLDFECWSILISTKDSLSPPMIRTMGEALGGSARLNAISRLLALGILKTEYIQATVDNVMQLWSAPAEQIVRYSRTPFGEAVRELCIEKLGLMTPRLRELARQLKDQH